jgi:hypothetical protein
VDQRYGSGHVLVFATSADRTWSNFPLSPYFLPLIHQAVQFGAGLSGGKPYNWTTRSMTLRGKLAEPGVSLTNPEGLPIPVRATVVDGETTRFAENLMLPGIYRNMTGGRADGTPILALNVERRESDLAPIQEDEILTLLGDVKVNIARGLPDLERLIEDHRIGRSLSEACLWLVLCLTILEILFANFKARTAKASKAPIAAEASGRIVKKPGRVSPVKVRQGSPKQQVIRAAREFAAKLTGKRK